MKRKTALKFLICILLVCISVFCFTACGNTNNSSGDNNQNNTQSGENNSPSYGDSLVVDGGVRYQLTNGTASVVGFENDISEAIIKENVTINGAKYSVTIVKERAFYFCSSLKTVSIPNTVNVIGDEAFSTCASLITVSLPNNISSINKKVFFGCVSLKSITIPDSVKSIGDYAFWSCSSLTEITIPDNVTSISDSAFYTCDTLKTINIGKGVTSIADSAFNNCSSLTSITVAEENQNYKSLDGNLFSKDGKELIQYALGKTSVEYVIPDQVTTIKRGAFADSSQIVSITIPSSVTSIGQYAFHYCSKLENITFKGTTSAWQNLGYSNYRSVPAKQVVCSDGNIAIG